MERGNTVLCPVEQQEERVTPDGKRSTKERKRETHLG
jgi:hypothetical protein